MSLGNMNEWVTCVEMRYEITWIWEKKKKEF